MRKWWPGDRVGMVMHVWRNPPAVSHQAQSGTDPRTPALCGAPTVMTDANLMDADCIHSVTWYECDQCVFTPYEPWITLRRVIILSIGAVLVTTAGIIVYRL